MPWKSSDAKKYNSNLTRKQSRKWAAVANSSLRSCIAKGGAESECAGKAITIANGIIKRDKEKEAMKMTEVLTKKIGGKSYPASCFLVVEDPQKSTTWHLPVKSPDGKADHRLMGAAWAALHGGYRGNKYEGSGKAEAIKKLKALYDDEDMETPAESYEGEDVPELAEYWGNDNGIPYVPSSIISFDQLDSLTASQEMSDEIRELTGAFTQMVNNIVYWFEGDKVAQLRTVSTEFADRIDMILHGEQVELPEAEPETTSQPADGALVERFAEAEISQVLQLEEADISEADAVTHLNVAIIKPGWGNQRDNHFYPAAMLRSCAERFVGAKMYETDHRQDEKSTRTWVSTITDIAGYTDDGAPIARVAIHDPNFAQRVKNLNTAGLLQKMECSIFANGTAEAGFEQDGRKGKKVTEITDVESVDWVTRAGAGGRVLALTESDEGGDQMNDTPTTGVEENAQVEQPENTPVAETSDEITAPVAIIETENDGASESQPETTTEQAEEAAVNDAPAELPADAVRSLLETSRLPQAAQERLASFRYADQAALDAAITAEREYLSRLLEAGKVFGMGAHSAGLSKPQTKDRELLLNEAAQRVNNKFFRR